MLLPAFIVRLLEIRWKLPLHIIQLVLIVIAIGLAGGRISIRTPPITRSNILVVSMSIKSLVVLAYQLLTEHVKRFHRWASTLADAILNSLEVMFWLAVIVVTAGTLGTEKGAALGITAAVITISIILVIVAIWVAAISIKVRREFVNDRKTAKAGCTKSYGFDATAEKSFGRSELRTSPQYAV